MTGGAAGPDSGGKLAGKVVLVTGGGVRVGRAISLACAREGASVAVHYRSSLEAAAAAVAEIEALGVAAQHFAADLVVPDDARRLVDRVVEQFGGIDVLVNNAATFVRASFDGGDEQAWERAWRTSFETNLLAPARLVRYAAPSLRARCGVVVNLIDVGASLAWPDYAHHTAAKAGLAHLTRTLAVALGPEVRVAGVAPGIAAFPADMPVEERNELVGKTALRRPGTPQGIASAVTFLAAHDYITGQILTVDGGWSLAR